MDLQALKTQNHLKCFQYQRKALLFSEQYRIADTA